MAEDIGNVEQDEYWNTAEAGHWVEFQDRYDALLGPFDRHLLGAAEVSDHDHVLDVGCGCGATTRAAARIASGGDALGVDLSAAMLERARALAAHDALTNVGFARADAQTHEFGGVAFDVAISRFGVMFFADPVAAFANVAKAVGDRGRVVFLCWQELLRNDWLLVPRSGAATVVALPGPGSPDEPGTFALADPDRVRAILSAAGWRDVNVDEVREPLRLGSDAEDATAFLRGTGFARRLFEGVDALSVDRAIHAVRDALAAHETPEGVVLGSAAWLVSAAR